MAVENWLPVPGYEGLYEVSDQGRVRNAKTLKLRTLVVGSDGRYYSVVLYGSGKPKNISIHRMVLMAFERLPVGKEESCHRDDDWRNNKLSNLYWGTRLQNEADKIRNGNSGKGSKNSMAVLNEKKVKEIKKKLLNYVRGDYRKLADFYGVSRTAIEDIAKGRRWNHIKI